MRPRSPQVHTALIAAAIAIGLLPAIACGSTGEAAPAAAAPTATPRPAATPTTASPPAVSTEAQTEEPSGQVELEQPYDEQADPAKDIEAALALAKTDSKYVLLDFGANWCLDCVVLSKLFEDPKVKPYLEDNFHVVQIDVGYWDRNLDIAEKYDNPIEIGIPAVVILTPQGEMVATTKAGELATASTATADDILAYLQTWAPKKQ